MKNPKTPEDIIILNEETRNLIELIQALDDLPKEIITLRIYGDLSFKEIGQLVEKSENYVRVTFHRTKLNFKKKRGEMMTTDCSIVEDLLPLYTESLLQDETTNGLKAHLENCAECATLAKMSY